MTSGILQCEEFSFQGVVVYTFYFIFFEIFDRIWAPVSSLLRVPRSCRCLKALKIHLDESLPDLALTKHHRTPSMPLSSAGNGFLAFQRSIKRV